MIRGLERLCCEGRLGDLFILKERRLWGDVSAAFQYLGGVYKRQGLFIRVRNDKTRCRGLKAK